MNLDQLLWLTSRTAALTAFVVLAVAIVTGQALRTSLLAGWVHNRELGAVHQFLTVCWVPLVAIHVAAITLDGVARLSWVDAFIPFRSGYAGLPVGLGTLAFDVLVVLIVASYLRKQMSPSSWRFVHRLSYLMFALFVLHAFLSGTDLSRPWVAAAAWAIAAFTAILTVARIAIGRLKPNTL